VTFGFAQAVHGRFFLGPLGEASKCRAAVTARRARGAAADGTVPAGACRPGRPGPLWRLPRNGFITRDQGALGAAAWCSHAAVDAADDNLASCPCCALPRPANSYSGNWSTTRTCILLKLSWLTGQASDVVLVSLAALKLTVNCP
jgi:hypothetical protein